jgi:DNA-binding XRE family transcriptional regulator
MMKPVPGLRGVSLDDHQRALLVERRTELGLTQEQLAKQIGLKRITIHTIEAGKYLPSQAALAKLCKALSLDCDIAIEVHLHNAKSVVSSRTRAKIHQRPSKKTKIRGKT